jgi:putative ABC transport system substrate-binding protein
MGITVTGMDRYNRFFLIVLVSLLFPSAVQAQRVAIFDYDDRLDDKTTIARYIEKKLTEQKKELSVDQFSGKENTPHSIKVLERLDKAGYDLIITITSDALIIANHIIKQTPTLFTNVTNPLSLGFQTLGPPGRMISGASYYISVDKQLTFYQTLLPDLKKIGFIFDQHNKSKKVELPEVREKL